MIKTRSEVIKTFGSVNGACEALGITRQAFHGWMENLNHAQIDRVTGAAIRKGLYKPKGEHGTIQPD